MHLVHIMKHLYYHMSYQLLLNLPFLGSNTSPPEYAGFLLLLTTTLSSPPSPSYNHYGNIIAIVIIVTSITGGGRLLGNLSGQI